MGQEESRARIDRRDFMRRAGALGAMTTFPGLLAACGSSDDSSGGGDKGGGDALKIGYVTPSTGALAAFAEADNFILEGVRKTFADGIPTKKGKRDVEIIVKDSQSNPDRAGTVASDLILKDGVDLVLVASTPETTNPVSDQCELNGMPCISTMAPWQSWFFPRKGDPKKPFVNTWHYFWGLEDLTAVYTDIWGQLKTNKTVGALWPNDGDGNAFADPKTGFPAVLKKGGYTLRDPGRYENATNDFSAQINRYKSGSADILTGVPIPPDFTNFYKQASQQGYRPSVVTIAKAVLFPSAVEALGDLGEGLTTEVWWSPSHPFKSSLTEQGSKELSDAFTESSGKQWTQPIGFVHSLFEVAKDVMGRASDPKDKKAVVAAIKSTNLDTIVGKVAWGSGPVPNVAKAPLTGGQWRKKGDGYDLVIVSNSTATQIPKTEEARLIGA
jgi:branched-chain amino acid transport system substrate-binding protein